MIYCSMKTTANAYNSCKGFKGLATSEYVHTYIDKLFFHHLKVTGSHHYRHTKIFKPGVYQPQNCLCAHVGMCVCVCVSTSEAINN